MAADPKFKNGPLSDLRVIEMGTLLAGPFCGQLLGDMGAEVIKIEPPGQGDPLRVWGRQKAGEPSLWWPVVARNKKAITLDMRQAEGQKILKDLVKNADFLLENFRPGTMEKWGCGWEELQKINPRLIMIRVSGYGQSGPYAHRAGFGAIGEAMGGLRHLTGEPGRVPVRVGVSIGDTLAALHGVIGILLALQHRQSSGRGQVIDVALYEAVFNCMESLLPEYSAFGAVREPAGSAVAGAGTASTERAAEACDTPSALPLRLRTSRAISASQRLGSVKSAASKCAKYAGSWHFSSRSGMRRRWRPLGLSDCARKASNMLHSPAR